MKQTKLRTLILAAMFAALICVATMFIRIPTPGTGGYANAGDGLMLTAAFLLEREVFEGLFYGLMLILSPFTRYEQATLYGLFDVNVLLLLLSVPLFFLYMTAAVTERRRCR